MKTKFFHALRNYTTNRTKNDAMFRSSVVVSLIFFLYFAACASLDYYSHRTARNSAIQFSTHSNNMFSEIRMLRSEGTNNDLLHQQTNQPQDGPTAQDAGEWYFVPIDHSDMLRTAAKRVDQERAAQALVMRMRNYKDYSGEAEKLSQEYLHSTKSNLKKSVLFFMSVWFVYFLLTFIRNGKNPFSS